MRLEIFILGLTAFFVYNTYSDGKYTKMMMSFKKYYKMIFYALLGIGIYYLLKKNPRKGKDMLLYANNYIKYLPIDKNSIDMLSPIIDFTGTPDSSFMESFNGISPQTSGFCSEQRILSSGKGGTNPGNGPSAPANQGGGGGGGGGNPGGNSGGTGGSGIVIIRYKFQ